MFEVGQKVKWSSQAGGNVKEKVGIVVAVLERKNSPKPVLWLLRDDSHGTRGCLMDMVYLVAVIMDI